MRGTLPRDDAARPLSVAAGFSILEILVALAIGALILLALGDVLVSSKVNYLREETVARIQESGRFATLALGEQVRSARSLDCFLTGAGEQMPTLSVKSCDLLKVDDCAAATPADRASRHLLNIDEPLGYDAAEQGEQEQGEQGAESWLAGVPRTAATDVRDRWLRGDVLVSWGLVGTGVTVKGELPWPGDPNKPPKIELDGPIELPKKAVAVISDCQSTDVFTVTKVVELSDDRRKLTQETTIGENQVNVDALFSAAYNVAPTPQSPGKTYRARVFPLRYSVFYICCTDSRSGQLQRGGNVEKCRNEPDRFRPALCAWDLSGRNTAAGTSQALIPEVADLRVTWGSVPGVPNGFSPDDRSPVKTSAWITANRRWPDVSIARVELLVAGTEANRRVKATPVLPASPRWPPNPEGADSLDPDTLGFALPADTRLYQRFVISLTVRSRTPWYLDH